jgi:hypothetical protein
MQAVVIDIENEIKLQKDPTTIMDIPLTSWEEYKWKKTYSEQTSKKKSML